MKYVKILIFATLLATLTDCSSSSTGTDSTDSGPSGPSSTPVHFSAVSSSTYPAIGTYSGNTMAVTVNGGSSGSVGNLYDNEPTVSVTICSPSAPSTCQTIDNVLLDTGSFGLRLFSSVVTVPLVPVTNGSNTLGECVVFGDNSSEWGPVEYAYVQLGGEQMVSVPIMVINSAYQSPPDLCTSDETTPDVSPEQAGFNGILGVGLWSQDCGLDCVSDVNNEQYYTCNGTNCEGGASVDLGAQVTNPVANLTQDNNGVVLSLPSVAAGTSSAAGGAATLSGTLYLGVDTETNNASTGKTAYPANSNVQFGSVFAAYSSSQIPGFIDSGSSIVLLPTPGTISDCGVKSCGGQEVHMTGFLCSSTTPQTLSITNYINSTAGSPVSFTFETASLDLCSSNNVFSDLTANAGSTPLVDWGLPFFYGRSVFVGITGTTSTNLGAGPYWAY